MKRLRLGIVKSIPEVRPSDITPASNKSIIDEYSEQKFPSERALCRPSGEAEANRIQVHVPGSREEWTDYLVQVVKSKTCVQHLSDLEVRALVKQGRKTWPDKGSGSEQVTSTSNPPDEDLPECYHWTVDQVAEWFQSEGFGFLTELIHLNQITGRKLIKLDANTWVRMGLRDVHKIVEINTKIRQLLDIPRPHLLRALARIVPIEEYLRAKSGTGKSIDGLTFKKFCEDHEFDYDYLKSHNLAARITCPCAVKICPQRKAKSSSDQSDSCRLEAGDGQYLTCDSNPELSASDASCSPLVEGDSAQNTPCKEKCITEMAQNLLYDVERTAACLEDLQQTRQFIERDVEKSQLEEIQAVAERFTEQVFSMAALLSTGELTSDEVSCNMKLMDEVNLFVEDIIQEASKYCNEERLNLEVADQAVQAGSIESFPVLCEDGTMTCDEAASGEEAPEAERCGKYCPCPLWPPKSFAEPEETSRAESYRFCP